VESLLEQVNRAKGRLEQVAAVLKRFRQAVLAAACSGELTSNWRTHNHQVSPQGLNSCEQEPDDVELPTTWAWAPLGNACKLERGRFSVRPRNDPSCYGGAYPFVQIGDLPPEGGAIREYHQTLNERGLSVSKMFSAGTILLAIVGATIGNTGILGFDSCCPDSLVAVQPGPHILLQYIDFFLRWRKELIRSISYASGGQPNISLKTLDPYPVPVPPLAEQHEIVRQVDRLFALADTIERRVAIAMARAEKLPQAILSKAFAGELVPTEAELARLEGRTYETAEALLARVRNEPGKTNAGAKPSRKRRGANKAGGESTAD
jgi:type I restriction enzyme, S subunit